MKVTAQAANYDATKPYKRYVKYVSGVFYWCEALSMDAYDARQGTVEHSELPKGFKKTVVAASFKHCHYVEWPK